MSSKYECSFCGKGDDEVAVLVAGPGKIFICDECIELCNDIIRDEIAAVGLRRSDAQIERVRRAARDVELRQRLREPVGDLHLLAAQLLQQLKDNDKVIDG